MTGPIDRAEGAAFWRRLRETSAAGDPSAPDAMLLAAYAEGRLRGVALEKVEAWLAHHVEDAADARFAMSVARDEVTLEVPSEALVARALALVAAPDPKVVSFRPREARAPAWRAAVTWGSLAASILLTSLLGFTLGSEAYVSLSQGPAAVLLSAAPGTELDPELSDPSSGLLNGLGDEVTS